MRTDDLENPLPGYRDTRLYYNQLRSVLAGCRTPEEAGALLPSDPKVRHSTEEHFLVHLDEPEYRRRLDDPQYRPWIDLVRSEEAFGVSLLEGMESGRIRRLAIHGDTKLDNFLFSTRTGRVKALVDLDTIMPHTWLADWGDMVRSLVNVAGERERDLGRVRVDMEVYEAIARGFLTTAREVTPAEVERMPDAVETIALQLGVRFLADHLRGDSYFKLGPADPPDPNRVRAMVQLTLFQRLRARSAEARGLIGALRAREGTMQELKIGTSWVRGVVGEALTPELIVNFACAFGTWTDWGAGRDRPGHPPLASSMSGAAVLSGLLSPGCEVIDLGVCPTPSRLLRRPGAGRGRNLDITGSHNDVRWNALKFIDTLRQHAPERGEGRGAPRH